MLLADADSCYSEEMAPASRSISPSLSPSPPPPLPPQASTAARWTDLVPPHCQRCHLYTGPVNKDDDDSCRVICDREMHTLHRNVPALRRRDVDTSTIRQHYYPEGGWGWIVCGVGFLVHLLTSGLQLSFGLLYLYTLHHLGDASPMDAAWLGALCLAVSMLTAPLVVAFCRRKSTRLTAVFGGLVMALACLFASFAQQLHQVVLSYGVVLGLGAGLVRETSSLMLGHYFKRRREFVEMVVQAGAGVGIALFSVLYKEAVGKLGWRLGLQAVTAVLALGFFLGVLYRSASLYHPQRRAILHLKNQRNTVKEKSSIAAAHKAPFFDLSPLRIRAVQMLLLASSTAALGLYTPVFYLALQGYKEGLEDSALVLMQTFLGFATALGCVGFGLVVVRPSEQCLISRQYLCQAAMVGVGVSLLALSAVQGYHGYVLFVWLYGVCLGGFLYSLKMFTMERVKSRYFTRAWGFVQGAEAIPVLVGVPITGYINQSHPKAGYYFSFFSTMLAAALLFLVSCPKRPRTPSDIAPCSCASVSPVRPPLPKSMSFATTLDLPLGCISEEALPDSLLLDYNLRPLRPSKSVPEGLATRHEWPQYRRPAVRQEDTRHTDEHHEEEEVEEKQRENPQAEEDTSALSGCRANSKGLLAAKAGNNECVTVSEEMLFSMHGLDLTFPVLCDFCPRKFHDFTEFDAHMVTHKECRFFSCQLCSNTYLSWGNLVAHRKACHRGQVLSCDACGQRKFHPDLGCVNFPVEGSPIGCEECGEGFTTIMQLYRHYRLHGTHQFMPYKGKLTKVPERTAVGSVPMSGSCHVCSEFITHKQVAVDDSSHTDNVSHSEFHNAVEQKCLHSASHTCVVCGKVALDCPSFQWHCATHNPKSGLDHHSQECSQVFSESDEMTEHVGKKHACPDETMTCRICGHSWLSGREFLAHYKACHKDTARHHSKVTCPVCHKVFSQPSALGRHLKLHNPLSRHHICELCGEVIVHHDQVLIHARQHYGAELPEFYKKLEHLSECRQRCRESVKRKSFICEYCGREFNRKLNLQLHVRRHTGEKPYGCQLCGKAFYTNQQLAIHVRCHTGERPYTCGICSKSFTGPTALYIHRKQHDKVKRHLCPHCGKRFFWRSAFVGHVRLHTGERPYCCKICGKTFILKGKLNLHLKKHDTLACSDCGENFETDAELTAHRNEQCCVTMMTFVEEGPSGEKDTRIIVVNTEDLEQNNIYIGDTEVVQLVV